MTLFRTVTFGGVTVGPSPGRGKVEFSTDAATPGWPNEVLAWLDESEVRELIEVLEEAIER